MFDLDRDVIVTFLGRVTFPSGTLCVEDPCYGGGDRKTFKVNPDQEYSVYIRKVDTGSWGMRVSHLILVESEIAEDTMIEILLIQRGREYITNLGVDSGQMGFFDAGMDTAGREYDTICKLTLSGISGGVHPNHHGGFSSSGYGDGGYNLMQGEGFWYVDFGVSHDEEEEDGE